MSRHGGRVDGEDDRLAPAGANSVCGLHLGGDWSATAEAWADPDVRARLTEDLDPDIDAAGPRVSRS